jgi:hypothetical protein
MASLIEELQRDALDSRVRVSDLLRKAKTIAHKLNLPDLSKWVGNELDGYPDVEKVPDYRLIRGQLKGNNPFHGWQPVFFNDNRIEEIVSRVPNGQKVAEIEDLVRRGVGSGELMVSLNASMKQVLRNSTRSNIDFAVIFDVSSAVGILDAVRNALLDWSLKLEQAGIMGNGMSFSTEEREKAHETQAIYNIGHIETFTGNMGSGSGSFAVEGNVINVNSEAAILNLISKIRSNEHQLNLKPASAQQLNQILNGLEREIESKQPSPSRVTEFLASIRKIAEGLTGNLIAHGILYELSKFTS